MKKSNFILVLFFIVSFYSCNSSSNSVYLETWYSQKDTIESSFEIKQIDTTVFLDYNYLILKDVEAPINYFVILNKGEFSMNSFKKRYIKLKLSKLPCNFPLSLPPRSVFDIIVSPGGRAVLWIQNRVVVDAFKIIE